MNRYIYNIFKIYILSQVNRRRADKSNYLQMAILCRQDAERTTSENIIAKVEHCYDSA